MSSSATSASGIDWEAVVASKETALLYARGRGQEGGDSRTSEGFDWDWDAVVTSRNATPVLYDANERGGDWRVSKGLDLAYWAARYGRLEVLEWLRSEGVDLAPPRRYDGSGCGKTVPADGAAEGGHIDCMEFMLKNGYKMEHCQFREAAAHNRIPFLQHYYHQGYNLMDGFMCSDAAKGGHLDCIKFLRSIGCGWNRFTCQSAAEGGHLEVLKYAHQNGCEWNPSAKQHSLQDSLSYRAAKAGSLPCLKYVHENGWELNKYAAEVAARGGHLDCLKYLHQNGVELSCTGISEAAHKGQHWDCVEYIKANNQEIRNLCKELSSAIVYGELKKVELLLDAGANIDMPGNSKEEMPVIAAMEHYKYDIARLLIERGARVDATSRWCSDTLLHLACKLVRPELVRLLLEHHADVDARNSRQETSLHQACQVKGSLEVIKLLLDSGADIEASDSNGFTPLFKARDNIEAARLLLDRGANANAKSSGWTLISWACDISSGSEMPLLLLERGANLAPDCLHFACRKGNIKLVELLLQKGADPSTRDKDGQTPAHCASNLATLKRILEYEPSLLHSRNSEGQSLLHLPLSKEVYDFLLAQGIDVNSRDKHGHTPLHSAAHNCQYSEEPIQFLLDRGAIVDAISYDDRETPLHIASKRLSTPVAKLLLNHGANINAKDSHGNTPLHTACDYYRKTYHISFVSLLLDRGADMAAINNKGWTPLHVGCSGKRKDNFVRLMLQRGAYADAQDPTGATALHLAASRAPINCTDHVRVLLENGGSTSIRDSEGRTPLHVACENNLYFRYGSLVEKSLDLNDVDGKGRAPLHLAVLCADIAAVRDLLFKGVNVFLADYKGNTALHYACFEGHWDIAMLILRRGGGAALSEKNAGGRLPIHGIFDHDGAPLDLLFHAVRELMPLDGFLLC